MQNIARHSLQQFGYVREPIKFSLLEWARYAFITWPLNFVRMVIWLVIELVQHNLPGRFGRKPGKNMILKTTGEKSGVVKA
jgi:hypothetical protein